MAKRFWLLLFGAFCIAAAIVGTDLMQAAPLPGNLENNTLPIYRLVSPQVSEASIQQAARSIFGIQGSVTRQDQRLQLKSDNQLVEVDSVSGAIWAADQSQLWNPDLKLRLPDEETARKIANEFFRSNPLIPSPSRDQPYSIQFTNIGGTFAAILDTNKRQRTNQKLDVQVNYAVQMQISTKREAPVTLPVVGGGGEFNLTLGEQGKVIGFSGLWRQIEAVETQSPVIPQRRADEQFKQLVKGLKLQSFKSSLAYYSAPTAVEQRFLYPVYVYRAVAVVDQQRVPLRLITIPATEFGPKVQRPKPQTTRTQKNTPQRRSTMPEGPEEKGLPPDRVKTNPSKILAQSATSWREAGTSWIGLSGGLAGSQNNAKGFVDQLSADGWSINFNWGDANAWESDWRRNDDSWVVSRQLLWLIQCINFLLLFDAKLNFKSME